MHIHYWTTFGFFLALGFAQIAAAVYGGYLSALGLSPSEKKTHIRWFVMLGIILFVLTAVVGGLNDTNQFQSDQKQDRLSERLTDTYNRLGSIDCADKGAIEKMRGDILRTLTNQHVATKAPIPIPSPPIVPTPIPVPPADTSHTQSTSGSSNDDLIQQLRSTSHDLRTLTLTIGEQRIGMYRPYSRITPQPTTIPEPFKSQTILLNDKESTGYKAIQEKIDKLRPAALTALNLPPTQLTDDNKKYTAIAQAASAPYPSIPTSIEVDPSHSKAYDSMVDYLNDLATRLAKKQNPN